MLRSGRFRHRLLDDEFLQKNSRGLYKALHPFVGLWQKGQISSPEMAALYSLIFALFRRPQDFLGGELKDLPRSLSAPITPLETLKEILLQSLPVELQQNKALARIFSETNLLNGFARYSWRSIPESANRSLLYWDLGRYDLLLSQTIPTPEQVLDLQANGRRCVSLLTELSQIESFIEEGRDVWGFLIHDLIHADHFFLDPKKAQDQIQFCQRLQLLLNTEAIQKMLHEDTQFRSEFYYLMSDMNSVPLHLLKTLKAVLLAYFKRKENRPLQQNLPEAAERAFEAFFLTSLAPWELSEEALGATLRLNTPAWMGFADSYFLDQALSRHSP